ncbi:hypothetical protein K491DRAFT_773284 [Lophiostoma macrostomum CBS 122681]|uniref:Uncharacterized protein n=1 Tax=Lophiostoma macrostomum CBS 122681 TaxID=1314788 RepID=A0A6A6TRT1_9PLEO|nr:hypothetical protein K491DRAFT_773284 [Lophiostoma macrostomum CBS 122681]
MSHHHHQQPGTSHQSPEDAPFTLDLCRQALSLWNFETNQQTAATLTQLDALLYRSDTGTWSSDIVRDICVEGRFYDAIEFAVRQYGYTKMVLDETPTLTVYAVPGEVVEPLPEWLCVPVLRFKKGTRVYQPYPLQAAKPEEEEGKSQ